MIRARRGLRLAAAVVLPLLTLPAAASAQAPEPLAPIANAGAFLGPDGIWVVSGTGQLGERFTAPKAAGPYTRVEGSLVSPAPSWVSKDVQSFWAPSVINVKDRYVAFFAAVYKGQSKTVKRCIGTAEAATPTGPFVPRNKPISCRNRPANDRAPGTRPDDSLIDATPRYLTVNGKQGLYLTYKTQHNNPKGARGTYFSTVRMVQLDVNSYAKRTVGQSRKLTTRPDNIEENPVIVQRGPKDFTLFTSLGGYTLCGYHTEFRHSSNPWHWPARSTPVSFPGGTCGTGNGDVVPGKPAGSWRIFFSGHFGPSGAAVGEPFKQYVGNVEWNGTTPVVTRLLNNDED